MSRKKTAKRITKRPSTTKTFAIMQKDFHDAPAKLTTWLNKEIAALKQKEIKLKNAVSKITAQVKKSESRIQDANHVKNLQLRKKRLTKAKKSHDQLKTVHTGLNKELQATTKSLDEASLKYSKLAALRKHITQFEKEWAKQAKQARTTSKLTHKPKKRTKAKVKPITPLEEQSKFETYEIFETDFDDNKVEEPTEVAS